MEKKLLFMSNWYIACTERELKQKPIARTILGNHIVLFRVGDNKVAALLDRCPHRNIPLSQGWVKNNQLTCRYHGWSFDALGICQEVPGICTHNQDKNRNVDSFAVIERDNFIWVYPEANKQPESLPYQFPYINQPGFSTFSWKMQCETSLENVAENFLDATHTHFVHTGLIRTDKQRQEITVKIRRQNNMVEAVYLDEQSISGLIYNLLAPGCKKVVSIGRFILPSIAQLEYYTDKEDYKLFISLALTPIQENITQAYSVVTFRWGLPNWLGKFIAKPLFHLAGRQDKKILQLQSQNIKRFQGEHFVYTEIDIMRPHISYLLKQQTPDSSVFEKTVKIKL